MQAYRSYVKSRFRLALGALGQTDHQLMVAVLQQAIEHFQQQQTVGNSDNNLEQLTAQQLCNLSWSVAVLDMQQLIPEVLILVRFCADMFADHERENMQQLQQVHLWLLDIQQPKGTGLSSVLNKDQLTRCRDVWDDHLQQTTQLAQGQSHLQAEVFRALQQLALNWRIPPAMEQLSDPDGTFSIDISGVTADGVRLAVEADGPTHFRRPDNKPTGGTLYRTMRLLLGAMWWSVCLGMSGSSCRVQVQNSSTS